MKISPKTLAQNVREIVRHDLCIGCGLCAVVCPETAVEMVWQDSRTWQPEIDEKGCTSCSRCYKACPQTPECIGEYAEKAYRQGVRFGLQDADSCFIAYDLDKTRRLRSASGGATSVLLGHMLSTGAVDGVLASKPLKGKEGEPHFQAEIFRTVEELEGCRGSHYHPLNYADALEELESLQGGAVLGVPCIMRGLKRLPRKLQEKIKFKVCLVCSHNVTGAFTDCLARQEGVPDGAVYRVNLRDKTGIPDANNFNNLFTLSDREIRRNRFDTAFTDMWRNYYFAQECCLYCPDFYGADADVSVKDAWGRLSTDPLGISLLVVRNRELEEKLLQLKSRGGLFLEECGADEVFNSQPVAAVFKHEKVRDRLVWKESIRRVLEENHLGLGWRRRWFSTESQEYFRLSFLMKRSKEIYSQNGDVPVGSLIFFSHVLFGIGSAIKRKAVKVRKFFGKVARAVHVRLLGSREARPANTGALRVLISGGYGYGNVGDEAQLAANLQHWQKAEPGCSLTVLTPDLEYTRDAHNDVRVELAPRRSLFGRGKRDYYGSEKVFKFAFPFVAAICLFNCCLIRAGLPTIGVTKAQSRLLRELYDSDVLFLSGGGYLTGMTLTRLWDNMLLIRLADIFGIPAILSGQTIGVFKDPVSRRLAYWGLSRAKLIYLRDPFDSASALLELGLADDRVQCTYDDALFFRGASSEQVKEFLQEEPGLNAECPYVAVNVHYWGQDPESSRVIMTNVAGALDRIQKETGLQIVFVPMVSSDEAAISEVQAAMTVPSVMPRHDYSPALAVGLIQNAALCVTMKHHPIIFAMAASVPTVSMAFDDYYYHKNFGAMSIFRQQEHMLKAQPEKLSEQLCSSVEEVLAEKAEVSAVISQVVETLRPMSGKVIYEFTGDGGNGS